VYDVDVDACSHPSCRQFLIEMTSLSTCKSQVRFQSTITSRVFGAC